MGSYVVGVKQWGIPQSLKNVFVILEQNGCLAHSLSDRLQKMVGFKNIASMLIKR